LTGRVWLEDINEEDFEDETPPRLSDGEDSPFQLLLPEPGTCKVRVWQSGKQVSDAVDCADDGTYRVHVSPGVTGSVSVEIEVPGRLRGLLDAQVIPGGGSPLVPVALGLGYPIDGQVVDVRGDPVAGVEVQAMPSPNLGEPEPWRTLSDDEGYFSFTTLPIGPVDLQAIKAGYALTIVEAVTPEEGVLMVLGALIDLEGAVVADASLLGRAKARLEGSSVWPPIEKELTPEGGFSFERLPDGVYGVEVVVPASEEGQPEFASVPLENVTPDLRISLALVEAFRIPVKVVDPQGDPVPRARVTVGYSNISMLQRMGETDEEGYVRVGPLVPGPYVVRADAADYLPSEPVEIEIKDGDAQEQTLVLARPGRIEGIVLDEDGLPVPGADVLVDAEGVFVAGESNARARLFGLALKGGTGSLGVTQGKVPDIPKLGEEDLPVGGATTDESGRFVLDMLMPGTYALRAVHGLHAGSELERIELASGQVVTGIELHLRAGALLTGVVRDKKGQPILGSTIELPDGTRLGTDEVGAFDAGFHTGPRELIVRAPGFEPQRVEVDVGKDAVDLEIEMVPADAVLTGVVRDGNGQPIQGALVTVRPLDDMSPSELVETDDKGSFELLAMPKGPAELFIEHLDYVYVEGGARLVSGKRVDVRFEMEQGWTIPVLVRQKGSGDPLAGVMIRAGRQTTYTNAEGVATLRKMAGKRVEISATAQGWSPLSVDAKRPEHTAYSNEVLFELDEGGSIQGELTDERGEGVVGAVVVVSDPDGTQLAQTRTKLGGAWRVDGLPEGAVVIEVTPPSGLAELLAPIREESDVQRGQVTRGVQLRFDRL
jgi:hypothetical protein